MASLLILSAEGLFLSDPETLEIAGGKYVKRIDDESKRRFEFPPRLRSCVSLFASLFQPLTR
jgi:hypothetical protein